MNKLTLAAISLSLVASVSGCASVESDGASSSAPDSDSVAVGEIGGDDLVVHEAIAVRVDGADAHGVAIVLTDRPGACAALRGDDTVAASTTLTLFVPDDDASNQGIEAPKTDALVIEAPQATFSAGGAACAATEGDGVQAATRGTINLDAVDLSPAKRTFGTFNLHFGDDVIVGKFAAVYCDVPATTSDPLAEAASCSR